MRKEAVNRVTLTVVQLVSTLGSAARLTGVLAASSPELR